MTILEMLAQSGVLTLLGMGIVFGFLIILVVVISQFGRFSEKNPDKMTVQTGLSAKAAVPVPVAGNNAQVTAAISAAVNEYRKSK